MIKYYKDLDTGNLIRNNDGVFERYDKKTNKWIEDFNLMDIYIGSRPVDRLSNEDARKMM